MIESTFLVLFRFSSFLLYDTLLFQDEALG